MKMKLLFGFFGAVATHFASRFTTTAFGVAFAVPIFIKFTSMAMKVVYASFVISFMYNIGGMYFAIKGEMTPIFAAILMPISSITVVVFTNLTTNYIFKRLSR